MVNNGCRRVVDTSIPAFEKFWENVKKDDRWQERINDVFDEIDRDEPELEEDEFESNEEFQLQVKKREENLRKIAESKMKEEAEGYYLDIVDFLKMFYNKDTMVLYRYMTVDLDDFIDSLKKYGKSRRPPLQKLEGVGIYWSYDFKHAIGHWAYEKKDDIVLVATVNCNDVDFEQTIYSYLIFSSSDDDYGNENEITVFSERKIILNEIITGVINKGVLTQTSSSTKTINMKNLPIWT